MMNGKQILLSTERKFGLVMMTGFAIIGGLFHWKELTLVSNTAFGVSLFFVLVTLFLPKLLVPIEKYWQLFGEKISFVVTLLIVTVVYFAVICPIGIARQLMGVDKLKLKGNNLASMWEPVNEAPDLTKPY